MINRPKPKYDQEMDAMSTNTPTKLFITKSLKSPSRNSYVNRICVLVKSSNFPSIFTVEITFSLRDRDRPRSLKRLLASPLNFKCLAFLQRTQASFNFRPLSPLIPKLCSKKIVDSVFSDFFSCHKFVLNTSIFLVP